MKITPPALTTEWDTGVLGGAGVEHAERRVRDLSGVFADADAWAALPPDMLVYRTECVYPVPAGTVGGLFWGTTFVQSGTVGGEFFMTKGHIHAVPDRMEAYFTHRGAGVLLLMDSDRRCRAEEMTPGSVHLIPPWTAHRTVNVGNDELAFGACWPSDAGHDYETIARDGFAVRVFRTDAAPRLDPA